MIGYTEHPVLMAGCSQVLAMSDLVFSLEFHVTQDIKPGLETKVSP